MINLYAEHLGGFLFLSVITIPVALTLFFILRSSRTNKLAAKLSVIWWVVLTNIGLFGIYIIGLRSAVMLEQNGYDAPELADNLGFLWRLIFGVFDIVVVLVLTGYLRVLFPNRQ